MHYEGVRVKNACGCESWLRFVLRAMLRAPWALLTLAPSQSALRGCCMGTLRLMWRLLVRLLRRR